MQYCAHTTLFKNSSSLLEQSTFMFIEKSLEYQWYLMAFVLRVSIAQQITTDYSHSYCNGGHTAILINCLIEIKMRGSESQSQEAECTHVFRPTRPPQWVIYTDGNSKCLKCHSPVTITAYCSVHYRSSTSYWVEPIAERLIKLAQPFLRTSLQVLVLVSMTTANSPLIHALILNLVQYYYLYVMVNHLDTSPHSSNIVLQTHIFYNKIISIGIVFKPVMYWPVAGAHHCYKKSKETRSMQWLLFWNDITSYVAIL